MIMDYASKVKTTPEREERPATSPLSASPCSEWHVWQVEGNFIAAANRESAIDFYCVEWGVDRDDVRCGERHCDFTDYYADPEEDENPTSTMGRVAQRLINGGRIMPFEFAREF